ncbi:AraC family transcriptional regulator [Paraglaciecola sp. MB-3u-78]|jgi:AraC-like DNA-binding protein|uniref:AraC family transcriptional regulator n=1 Tax=Paraglaciecola sp. MB-3u-78 TaxID=2058332 RepID=UPI001E4CF9DD|nr:AraC family transcriptional regulator [Paraglaciecola sp. MB-3u-78]
MHSFYLKTLIKVLKARRLDVNRLLNHSGIKEADLEKELNLTAQQLDTISTNGIEMSQDLQLGLLVGSSMDIPSQGIFGYAIITSTTIGDALKLMVRYNRALLPSLDVKVLSRESRVEVLIKAPHLPDNLRRFYIELLYAAIMRSGDTLIPKGRTSIHVEFDYDAPYDKVPYQQLFGSKVKFSSNRSVLSFDEAGLDLGIATANPVARDIFRRQCDRLLSKDTHRGMVSERVQEVLLLSGTEFPTSMRVANQLHMSESTLQRRLAKEGYKFQQLLDQVRNKLAHEYLTGTQLTINEISALLGFSDAANFRRSFKRWSKKIPTEVRNEALYRQS